MRRFFFFVSLAPLTLVACASADGAAPIASESDDLTRASYVAIDELWTTPAAEDAWLDLRRALTRDFGDACGDTFCEGDYANLTSLDFTCAAAKATGAIKECAWVFAGSAEEVVARTGAIAADVPHFVCKVTPHVTAAELVSILGSPGKEPLLHRVLPGMKSSLYDALGDCFAHPIASTQLPKVGAGRFTDAGSALFAAADALRAGFDDVCGDTFCEGDYSDLASLHFTCSADASTGAIGSCLWDFAGSYFTIGARTGTVTAHAKSFRCPIPVKGTVTDLAKVLAAPGTVDAIHRALPGGTASAYDALAACL
jgi:hypothetical protein